MRTRPYLVGGLTEILDAVNSSLDDKSFRELAKVTCKAALNHNENDWIHNENPNLFWGDETMFAINALKDYAETQKNYLEKIVVKGKRPFWTPAFFDAMSETIVGKILQLQQPKEPEDKEDE